MAIGYRNIAEFDIVVNSIFEVPDFEEPVPNGLSPDLSVNITRDDICDYKKLFDYNISKFSAAWGVVLGKISEWLPLHDAFLIHSAVIEAEGKGVMFSALSGVGKTTHMLNWQKLLGKELDIVNGDKPIIRFLGDVPYAYDTPWNGKEKLGNGSKAPVNHICFIERSKRNYVTEIDKTEALNKIMKQIYMPKNSFSLIETLKLAEKFLSCCQLWVIHCNMELESAEIAYKTIFGK